MKKAISMLLIIIAASIGGVIGKRVVQSIFGFAKPKLTPTELTKAGALGANRACPLMVDNDTRMDSAVGYNAELRYYYTMVNYSIEELDTTQFCFVMDSILKINVCNKAELQNFLNNGVTLSYNYSDKSGKSCAKIMVDKSKCQD